MLRLSRFSAGAALLVVAALLMAAGPAAAEDSAPTVLSTWAPDGLAGKWQAQEPADLGDRTLNGRNECPGRERSWRQPATGRGIAVDWWSCADRDRRLWLSALESSMPASSPGWQETAPVFAPNQEILYSDGPVYVREWMAGRFVIQVRTVCPGESRHQCLRLNQQIARELAANMPQRPGTITGSRASQLTAVLVVALIVTLAGIGAAHLVARARRQFYQVSATSGTRFFTVGEDARRQRRQARRRRFGLLLVTPLAVVVVAVLPRTLTGTVSLGDAASTLLLLPLAIGGIVLLALSRDPFPRLVWPPLPGAGRWFTRALVLISHVLVGLVVLLSALRFGGALVRPLSDGMSTLVGALLTLVALPTFGLAWWLRRRLAREAWQRLANRPGPPFAYVQGFFDQSRKIAAPPLVRLGAPARLRALRKPLLRVPFDEFVAAQAAVHRPVVAVDVRRPAHPPPGLHRVPIGYATTGESWAHTLVITAGPYAGEPADAELVGRLVASHQDRPIAVVLPPWPPDQVAAELSRWRAPLAGVAPFDELGELPMPSGTLVAVHVPGRGWHAWGATEHHVWAYVRALHDALAFAASHVEDKSAPAGTPSADRLTVSLVSSDDRVADDLATGLRTLGLAVQRTPSDDPGVSAVVVLSRAALADPAWLSTVAGLDAAGVRVIPVQAEDIDAAAAPAVVTDVNWIRWAGPGSARTLADVFAAVTADPARYRRHRSLTGQARAWAAANRDPALLITDHRDAEEAADHIDAAAGDGIARPSGLTREYVMASAVLARRRRGGARKGWLAGTAAVLVFAGVIALTVVAVRGRGSANRLTGLVSSVPIIAGDRPDWAGELSGAILLQGNDEQRETARRALRTMLDQPWPGTTLGAGHDVLFTDTVPVAGGALTVDGLGTLTRWETAGGSVRWRRQLTGMPTVLDATPDGRTIAAADGRSLQLITEQPWRRETVTLPADAIRLAVLPAAQVVVVATKDGGLTSIGLRAPHARTPIGRFTTVLDVRRVTGGATARAVVVTRGGRVALVDTRSHRVAEQAPIPLPGDLTSAAAAIGADGSTVAVTGGNRTLYLRTAGSPLHSTGALVGEGAVLTVLPGAQIVHGSDQYGTRVLDGRTGTTTDPFRAASPKPTIMRTSDDGHTVLLSNGLGTEVWSGDTLAPIARPGPVGGLGTTTRSAVDGTTIKGTEDGIVVITHGDTQPYRVRAVRGAVTTVKLSAGGAAAVVGSALGEVTEVDVDHRTVVTRWAAPDGRPVTAIGWAAAPGRLTVRTAGGIWWSPRTCGGCGTDGPLLAALRDRITGCSREDNLAEMTEDTRRDLGLRVCRKSPPPEAG